jgi:thiol-disulfide isomerase/thioredoxin
VLFPREHYYPLPETFPDIREILADPAAKVLAWRTRVDGHECYVVERTAITESPIFNSDEEAAAWRKQNPDAQVWLIVNPNSKPGDKRIDEEIDRLAIDPRSGFMAARWARGGRFIIPGYTVKETGAEVPRVEVSVFPSEEILCTDFHEIGGNGRIPGRTEYRRYSPDAQGESKLIASREVVLEDFQANRGCPPDSFHVKPQPGYRVLDSVRGIQYTVGESEEQIPVLLAAAQAKKAFLEELKRKPAPPLKAAHWLNSEPIRLEDARGKSVQLHFWNIGCGPCMFELPQLQENWELSQEGLADPPLFIAVHAYVDGDGLQALEKLLREKRITFPVMVEAKAPGVQYWGKTSADYRVFSVPSDVWIDEQGHVARHDLEGNWISARQVDRWLNPEPPAKARSTAAEGQ